MAVLTTADIVYALIQFIMVLSVWSYLYKDNIFSRVSAQIVISISTVHYLLSNIKQVWLQAVVPMTTMGRWLYIVPIILGLLIYARLSKKYSWIAGYSYAVQLGLGTGSILSTLIAGSVIGLIVNIATAPFTKSITGGTLFGQLSALLIVAGAIMALTYWLFTKEAKGVLTYTIKIGRWFLMASIGLLYAQDILWSQSLFVGAMEMVLKFIKIMMGVPV